MTNFNPKYPSFRSWEHFIEYLSENPEFFLTWAQTHYPELAKKVQQEGWMEDKSPSWIKKKLEGLLGLFVVNPNSLHGKAYVTDAVKKGSAITGGTITIAGLINNLTLFPFIGYAFAGAGVIAGNILTGVMLTAILKGSNYLGEAAASNRPGNRFWSSTCGFAFGAVGLALTSVSGPGTELLLNSDGLAVQYANQTIEERVLPSFETKVADANAQVESQKEEVLRWESDVDELQEEARQHRDTLATADNGSDARTQAFFRLHGVGEPRFVDPDNPRGLTLEIQQAQERLKQERDELAQEEAILFSAQQALNDVSNDVAQSGAIAYLSENQPQIFSETFTEDGEIADGMEAMALAIDNFVTRLVNRDFKELGFPLFFMSLSTLTSLAAITSAFGHAMRRDVQMSWDESVKNKRDAVLHAVLEGIENKGENLFRRDSN